MPLTEDELELREIEKWFRQRQHTLRFDLVGDPKGESDWVALMIPDGETSGVAEGGGGPTKLAAARDAKERFEKRERDETG